MTLTPVNNQQQNKLFGNMWEEMNYFSISLTHPMCFIWEINVQNMDTNNNRIIDSLITK